MFLMGKVAAYLYDNGNDPVERGMVIQEREEVFLKC